MSDILRTFKVALLVVWWKDIHTKIKKKTVHGVLVVTDTTDSTLLTSLMKTIALIDWYRNKNHPASQTNRMNEKHFCQFVRWIIISQSIISFIRPADRHETKFRLIIFFIHICNNNKNTYKSIYIYIYIKPLLFLIWSYVFQSHFDHIQGSHLSN